MPRDHEQNLTPQQRLARLAGLIPRGSSTAARTPFVVLVVLLLGSGMLGLLLLNAALNEGSFELSELRKETQELMDEEQELRAEVDAYADPEALAERARELGMVPAGPPAFLGEDGTLLGDPHPTPAPSPTGSPDPETEGPSSGGQGPPGSGATSLPPMAPEAGHASPGTASLPPGASPPAAPTAPEEEPSPAPGPGAGTPPPAFAPPATAPTMPSSAGGESR